MPEASLIISNTSTPGSVPEPGFVSLGELVLNYADEKLFFKNVSNEIVEIGHTDTFTIQHDYDELNSYDYVGKALEGSLDSDEVWRVVRITINTDGTIAATDIATDIAWDDRANPANY